MTCPKIQSAKAVDDHTLVIEFNNKQKKKYDITPLLKREMFDPLKIKLYSRQFKLNKVAMP